MHFRSPLSFLFETNLMKFRFYFLLFEREGGSNWDQFESIRPLLLPLYIPGYQERERVNPFLLRQICAIILPLVFPPSISPGQHEFKEWNTLLVEICWQTSVSGSQKLTQIARTFVQQLFIRFSLPVKPNSMSIFWGGKKEGIFYLSRLAFTQ